MNDDRAKALIGALASPIRILLMAAFILLAKMGWFTWLTPENAHEYVNNTMDFLVVAVPAGYAIWAYFKSLREKIAEAKAKEPIEMIKAVDALPQVKLIETTPEMAARIPSPTVVPSPR